MRMSSEKERLERFSQWKTLEKSPNSDSTISEIRQLVDMKTREQGKYVLG